MLVPLIHGHPSSNWWKYFIREYNSMLLIGSLLDICFYTSWSSFMKQWISNIRYVFVKHHFNGFRFSIDKMKEQNEGVKWPHIIYRVVLTSPRLNTGNVQLFFFIFYVWTLSLGCLFFCFYWGSIILSKIKTSILLTLGLTMTGDVAAVYCI